MGSLILTRERIIFQRASIADNNTKVAVFRDEDSNNHIVRDAWIRTRDERGHNEWELLDLAKRRGCCGMPFVVLEETTTLRKGQSQTIALPTDLNEPALKTANAWINDDSEVQEVIDKPRNSPRRHVVLVTKIPGRTLSEFADTPQKLVTAIRHSMLAHFDLYMAGQILHEGEAPMIIRASEAR